jgi:threonylcarbamoyladenosine tRNA methylthiotransferase MtaB
MPKTFKIITLGCKVNQYESAFFKDTLQDAGWCQVSKNERADVSIINTCIVTQRASYQSRQAIRQVIRENPDGLTMAVGCYAQVFQDELSRIEGLDFIIGNTEKKNFLQILEQRFNASPPRVVVEPFSEEMPFDVLPMKGLMDRTRAFLKIQDGCESCCSYCIVPFARGPFRSLEPSNVLRMLQELSEEGYREVVLTGIHLGKYGVDLGKGIDLEHLLFRIGQKAMPLRIRLSSLEPAEIDQGLIEMMASEEWLCRNFHIPLQSGDNTILKSMNRHYTSGEFSDLIHRIHQSIPTAAIGVDVMAGFPGEDQQAFENTFSSINDLPVSYLHVFPFSPRKGTAAAGFTDQVSSKVIKERAAELRELGRKKREAFYRSCLGQSFRVLSEGWSSDEKNMIKGWSDNYLQVVFPSDQFQQNSLVKVRMERIGKEGVIGVLIE